MDSAERTGPPPWEALWRGWLMIPTAELWLSGLLGLAWGVLLALGAGGLVRIEDGLGALPALQTPAGLGLAVIVVLTWITLALWLARQRPAPSLYVLRWVLGYLVGAGVLLAAFAHGTAAEGGLFVLLIGVAIVLAAALPVVGVAWLLAASRRVADAFGANAGQGKSLAIARRELAATFVSPVAYVIGAVFLLSAGLWFFHRVFVPGQAASLRPLFEAMAYIMIFAVPLLTMRLVSEELRSGTVETLLTAPVSEAQVIAGKFLGVMGFYLALLAGTLVFLLVMVLYGQPDFGVVLSGYVGMVLLGAAFVSVGLFASCLTRHQPVAAIVAVALLATFGVGMQALMLHAPPPWNALAGRLNAMTYFKDFARGLCDTRGLVFFLGATAPKISLRRPARAPWVICWRSMTEFTAFPATTVL